MTTPREDKEFADKLMKVGDDVVEAIRAVFARDAQWVVDWVSDNFDPGEVFADEVLREWAEKNIPKEAV